MLATSPLKAAQLQPEAIRGWNRYVAAAETRMRRELDGGTRFLVLDFTGEAATQRRALLAGDIVIREMTAADAGGQPRQLPDALVHHWRGAIFIPGISVRDLLQELQARVPPSPDVLRAAILERRTDGLRVFLRLRRTRIVTVVYDTEHDVRFRQRAPTRATSVSVATRIAEVEDPGTPGEHVRPPGDDHGFLWRLNAYWRYQEVQGGVIAECESLSLSRSVPFVLRAIASPLIDGTARESLEQTLVALKNAMARRAARTPRAPLPAR
jgi:hypothetical protein